MTYPPEKGGLGFHYKWDMGWMNDTLRYMSIDFDGRKYNHGLLTFSMMYAFSENYILPLSHDEVVHGKRSLIGRMPGDWWRQFAGARLLPLYAACHPGGMLSFMGNEFAQFIEWRDYEELEWFLLQNATHAGVQAFIRELNHVYRAEKRSGRSTTAGTALTGSTRTTTSRASSRSSAKRRTVPPCCAC